MKIALFPDIHASLPVVGAVYCLDDRVGCWQRPENGFPDLLRNNLR